MEEVRPRAAPPFARFPGGRERVGMALLRPLLLRRGRISLPPAHTETACRVLRETRGVRGSLADAEGAEDAVQDVVGGGGAGESVERAEGGVTVEQQQLVRQAEGVGLARLLRRLVRFAQ